MQITTKAQAKTFVSALRRELKALAKPTDRLSHTECLGLMAKAMGFSGWNALEAVLKDEPASKKQETSVAKYPLVNEGDFDFVPRGEHGTVFSGHFTLLEGTVERVAGVAGVTSAARHGKPEDKDLDIGYEGTTDIDWDGQQTLKDARGYKLWADEDGEHHSGAQLVFLPDDYYGDPYFDEELPVRDKLITAFVEYCKEKSVTAEDLSTKRADIEKEIGFSLTMKEAQALLSALQDKVPATAFSPVAAAGTDAQGGECPSCGTKDCGHTPEQMHMFALDAVKDAADWLESLDKPEGPKAD